MRGLKFLRANVQKFSDACAALPPSGGGGCHVALLGAANLARQAGISPQVAFEELRRHVHGSRDVPDSEIWDAIDKAYGSPQQRTSSGVPVFTTDTPARRTSASRPTSTSAAPGKKVADIAPYLTEYQGIGEEEILAASPVAIPSDPKLQGVLILNSLYRPTVDYAFVGENNHRGCLGHNLAPADRMALAILCNRTSVAPHVIPNPLSGKSTPTRDGLKRSYRSDSCVSRFARCVAEFDDLPRGDQLSFWAGIDLPIEALIDSGGKSVHAWIRVDRVNSLAEWDAKVKHDLYVKFLIPLGVDPACSNPSRLSRMPGHFRVEKGNWQRLLYLAPGGRRVFP